MFLEIQGTTQSYAWGNVGLKSKVATLSQRNGLKVEEEKPYAELWMGTHPSGPSVVLKEGKPLKSVLDPSNVGEKVWNQYKDLPFLFKILSINKALSIQAHPDKVLGAKLHAQFPEIYKDPNHKPEMAIALTPFEAFIGFRPVQEISSHISLYPEFKEILGQAGSKFQELVSTTTDTPALKSALKAVFTTLQKTPQTDIEKAVSKLVARLASQPTSTFLDLLILRLDKQFPNDVGTFCALMLNYVHLKSGDAIFLAANEPHAYLSGDCVECMAASDNVVRSGLTPKFKDVDTLVEMLTYNFGSADSQILKGSAYSPQTPNTREYNPPIEEFSILQTLLPKEAKETVTGIQGPSILIVVGGEGKLNGVECGAGSIFYIGAGQQVEFEATGAAEPFTSYRAFCTV